MPGSGFLPRPLQQLQKPRDVLARVARAANSEAQPVGKRSFGGRRGPSPAPAPPPERIHAKGVHSLVAVRGVFGDRFTRQLRSSEEPNAASSFIHRDSFTQHTSWGPYYVLSTT